MTPSLCLSCVLHSVIFKVKGGEREEQLKLGNFEITEILLHSQKINKKFDALMGKKCNLDFLI